MQTCMSPATFEGFGKLRRELAGLPKVIAQKRGRLAGIFIPWSGAELEAKGGIYYVGIATSGEFGGDEPQDIESRWAYTEDMCGGERHKSAHTPFWQFLDRLTLALLGEGFTRTRQRWGWSNLMKIGWSVEPLPRWLAGRQADLCAAALREETAGLRNTLIFIATSEDHGVLERCLGAVAWNKDHAADGVWWMFDARTRNVWIHGYHPAYLLTKRGRAAFEGQVATAIGIARDHLAWAPSK
jgi:hypothetical protein